MYYIFIILIFNVNNKKKRNKKIFYLYNSITILIIFETSVEIGWKWIIPLKVKKKKKNNEKKIS